MMRRLPNGAGLVLALLALGAFVALGACRGSSPAPAPTPTSTAPAPAPAPYYPPQQPAPMAAPMPVAPAPAAPSGAVAAQVERGRGIYAQSCASCHGASGEGGGAPMLIGAGALPRDPRPGSRVRMGTFRDGHDLGMFVKDNMPPGARRMDPTNVAAVVAFLLTSNGYTVAQPISPSTAGYVILHP